MALAATDLVAFKSDGFLVVRNVIPLPRLPAIRAAFEQIVQNGLAKDPGFKEAWQGSAQPRLMHWERHCSDPLTAGALELMYGPTTLGVSEQLLAAESDHGAPVVGAPAAFMLMCSPPETNHGPAHWHRDMHPNDQAPLGWIRRDGLANGYPLIQWNIALYDDRVLLAVGETVILLTRPQLFNPY